MAIVAVGLTLAAGSTVAAGGGRAPATASAGALPRLGPPDGVEYDDVGDPFVMTVPPGSGRPGRYMLFWTTDWQSNVPTAVSADLRHWTRVADALPVLPSWAEPSFSLTWAPAAQAVPGGWVLYYSTEDAALQVECIGAAFSIEPTGPYTDSSPRPLVCQPVSGPCRATRPGPFLASSRGVVSPGGFDTFTDLSGRLWASWSAFPSAPPDARAAMAENRVLEIAPVLSH